MKMKMKMKMNMVLHEAPKKTSVLKKGTASIKIDSLYR